MVNVQVVIPTAGRTTLFRTLESIRNAGATQDDLITIATDGLIPHVQTITQHFKELRTRIVVTPYERAFGHGPRNHALHKEPDYSCSWLWYVDDDDLVLPWSFPKIKTVIAEANDLVPLLAKFRTGNSIVWSDKVVGRARVGGHCLIHPNVPGMIGTWDASRYDGDFDFIESTLAHYPEGPVWREEILVLQNGARDQ